MSAVILVSIAAVCIIPLWLYNKSLYAKATLDPFAFHLVHSHNTLNAPPNAVPLAYTKNFIDINVNFILKWVLFAIVYAIIYFFDSSTLGTILIGLYGVYNYLNWNVYRMRKRYYNDIEQRITQDAFKPILKASFTIPLYHTLLLGFLLLGIFFHE